MHSMTRKRFLKLVATAAPAAAAFGLMGCADDDNGVADTGTTGPGTTGTTDGMTTAPTTTMPTTGATGDGTTSGMETTGDMQTTTTAATETAGDTTAGTTGADGTTTTGAAVTCDTVMSEVGPPNVGPPHDHMLMVPAEDVEAGEEVTYETSLEAGHFHEVTVTPEDFEELAAGNPVMTQTLEDATGHVHPVTLACE